MPTPWAQVAASPQYQSLPPDQKEAARRQYFEQVVAPQVPPEQVEAARKQFNDQTAFTPGPLLPPSPNPQAKQDMIRAGLPNDPGTDLLKGGVQGGYSTALGMAQMGSRTPMGLSADWVSRHLSGTSPNAQLDQRINNNAQQWAQDPASQTGWGKMGEFGGGMVATAPLAALAVPARGAGALSILARGGTAGALTAMTQPVDGENFFTEKGKQAAVGGAFGVGIPAVGRGAIWTGERLFGPNLLAQLSNFANSGANKKAFTQESEDLAARTGVRFTPGQVSGSKVQTALENMSRQSVFSADRAFEADTRIAKDAVRYMDKLMDNVSRNPASEASIGTQMQAVSRGAVEKIATRREEVAAQQYGAIDKALNGRAFVKPTNAMREADAIIAEYGSVPGPEAARITKQAQALKEQLANKQAYTFTEAQKARGYYGRGARGASNVFDDVNPDINRKIATRLFKAFDEDMNQSAAGLSGRGPGLVPHGTVGLEEAIKNANANYRNYSQLIEATKLHPIARLFGDNIHIEDVVHFDKIPPETVINRLTQMHPSELTRVRQFMEGEAPEAWQQYKRLLLEKAMSEARVLPTSQGANVVPFNASRFMRALGGDKPEKIKQLQAIYSAKEMSEIDDAFAVARRLGDRFGYNGPGTGPYNEVSKFANDMWGALKGGGAKVLASTGGEVMGLRKVANVMLNSDGRRALIQLSKLPPKSKQAVSLVAYLTALMAGQQNSAPGVDNRAQRP